MTLNYLFAMAFLTLRNPRAGAQWALSIDMPRRARWEALLLVVVLSVILILIAQFIGGGGSVAQPSVLGLGIGQLVIMAIMAFAISAIGRAMGGTGDFDGALILVAWLQFVLFTLQLVQFAALLLLPSASPLIGILAFALSFWMLTHFVAELHGFKSLGNVLVGILLSLLAFSVVLTVLLSIAGLQISLAGGT